MTMKPYLFSLSLSYLFFIYNREKSEKGTTSICIFSWVLPKASLDANKNVNGKQYALPANPTKYANDNDT